MEHKFVEKQFTAAVQMINSLAVQKEINNFHMFFQECVPKLLSCTHARLLIFDPEGTI